MSGKINNVTRDMYSFSEGEIPVSHANNVVDSAWQDVSIRVAVVMLCVFALVGTIGNTLVLYVTSSRRDESIATMFIKTLAIVDLTTCAFVVPFTVFMELVQFNVSSDFVCKLYIFLITFNIPFSSLLMTAIAVDRYLCICHPFWHKANVTRSRWVIANAVLGLFSGCLGLFTTALYSVYSTVYFLYEKDSYDIATTGSGSWPLIDYNVSAEPLTSATAYDESLQQMTSAMIITMNNVHYCGKTDMLISFEVGESFRICYHGILLGCLLVISILYPLIYRSVRQGRRWRKKRTSISLSITESHSKKKQCETTKSGLRLSLVRMTKTEVRQCVAMTTATRKSANNPPTVDHLVNPISTGDVRVTAVGVISDGGRTKDDQMESIIHRNIGSGCDQLEHCEEIKDNRGKRHTDADPNIGVGVAELHTVSKAYIDLDYINSKHGNVEIAINGRIYLPVTKSHEKHADNKADIRSTNADVFNGDRCGSIWDKGSAYGACQAEETTPDNEKWLNTAAVAFALRPDHTPPAVNCRSSEFMCVGSVQSAASAETVDLPPCESAVDKELKIDTIEETCLTTSLNGAKSLSSTHRSRFEEVNTAVMLFVVTFVFALTFLPKIAMSLGLISYHPVVFYIYFFNYVANPIIYSFMCEKFRKQLKNFFNKRRQQ